MKLFLSADEWDPLAPLQAFVQQQGHQLTCFSETDRHDHLAGFDAGFMYIHKPLESKVERALLAYANNGGRLIVLHHGISSSNLKNPDWLRFVGIHLEAPDAVSHPWKVESNSEHALINLNPGHYVTTNGVEYVDSRQYTSSDSPSASADYEAVVFVSTEFFRNQHIADGREKTVLFGSRCEVADTGEIVMQDRGGWFKRTGSGWLFYFQPGHVAGDFETRAYLQILHNCLTWDGLV